MPSPYILRKGVSELADLKDGGTARARELISKYQLYVDSNNGSNGNGGDSMDAPLADLDYAVGKCTANANSVIFLMPNHAETINAAAAIDLDVAGIRVVGLGSGEDRPTITVGSDETATTVEVGAANVTVENVLFKAGVDALAIMIDVNADDCTLINCEMRSDEGTSKKQALTYVDVNGGGANAADRFKAIGCTITSITAGANQAIEIGAVQDGIRIESCVIDGDFANAGIHSGSIFTNAVIANNYVSNRETGDHAIELTAACTGALIDNRLYGDTLGTILDPGSLKCLGNLETDAVDQAGVDSPRTSAGGFADDSITASVIADNAIDAGAIASNAIAAAKIASDAITAAKIADDALASEHIANSLGVPRIAAGNWNYSDDGASTPFTLFTVTGDVVASVFGICNSAPTSGGTGTIEVGVAGATATIIAQVADATDLIQDEIWYDATPTTTIEQIDVVNARQFIIPTGQDIILTLSSAGDALTGGDIDFYAIWYPLSSDGNVVAA